MIIIFILITVGFFWKVFFRGLVPFPGDMLVGAYFPWMQRIPIKNPLITDVFSQFYLWKTLIANSFRNFHFPLWNPYSYSGYPLLANFHSGALNPFNLFALIFGSINAWSILIIIQTFGSLLTMYLFIKSLKKSNLAALLAAIIYAFSGFAISWSQFVTAGFAMLWLPLIFLAINNKKFKYLPILYFLLMSSGHLQSLMYGLVFSALYYLYKFKLKHFIHYAIFSILGIGLMGLQLLPSLEMAKLSIRFGENYIKNFNYGLFPISHLITSIAPDFFGNPTTQNYWGFFNYHETIMYCGIAGIFAIIFCLYNFKKLKLEKFFIFSLLISLIFVIDNPLSRLAVSTSAAGRLIFVYVFSIAVLSSYWLDEIKISNLKKILSRYWSLALLFLTIFSIIYLLRYFIPSIPYINVSFRNLILPGITIFGIIFILSFIKNLNLIKYLIILVTIFDLFRFGWKYTPFVSKDYVFANTPEIDFLQSQPGTFRIDREIGEVLPPNTWTAYDLQSPSGYDPMAPAAYVSYYNKVINKGEGVSRYSEMDKINADVLGDFNVKYILSVKRDKEGRLGGDVVNYKFVKNDWTKVFETKNLMIMENQKFKPRVETLNNSQVSIVSYQAEKIIINYDNPSDTKLILRDSYYPGWIAKINQIKTPIQKYNIFRQIDLPKGKGTVEFLYSPNSFKIGVYISLSSLFIWLILIFLL